MFNRFNLQEVAVAEEVKQQLEEDAPCHSCLFSQNCDIASECEDVIAYERRKMKHNSCKYFGGATELHGDIYLIWCKQTGYFVWAVRCQECGLFDLKETTSITWTVKEQS